MQLVQWNPFREMDDFFKSFQHASTRGLPVTAEAWAPAVDISETPQEYRVKAELSGVNKDDIKVTTQNGVLTLSGERKAEKVEKDEKHHRIERSYGSFTRSFVLPDDVAEDRITAECKDGVVLVRLPKTEAPKAKSIEVKVH
ncbi:MAG: Hsp20/alpha crystallin family protein [Nevskiaceae bacterium]|nr:MAG: Hsp20/alpha crystallin family protein [Nevskiaceae bacterium]